MTPSATDLLVLALAASALLDAWFREDSILAERRAVTQEWRWRFGSNLLNCPFCLSFWVTGGLAAGYLLAPVALPDWAVAVARTPVWGLAATALVWLLEDVRCHLSRKESPGDAALPADDAVPPGPDPGSADVP